MEQLGQVLIIEDEIDDYIMLRRLISKAFPSGNIPVLATNLLEAKELIAKQPIDLIFLDLRLPDTIDDFNLSDFCWQYQYLPVIVVTGILDDELETQLLEHGAADYLLKQNLAKYDIARVIKHAKERHKLRLRLYEQHYELSTLQSQVMQAEKLAAIGQLATSIAADIDSPLGQVMSQMTIFKEYSTITTKITRLNEQLIQAAAENNTNEVRNFIKEIENSMKKVDLLITKNTIHSVVEEVDSGLKRIHEIVMGLKQFSHTQLGFKQQINVNHLLENTLKIMQSEIKNKGELIKNLDDLPLIEAKPGQLGQVFFNIILNAIHAIGESGTITITTVKQPQHVLITIADNGCGIAKEDLIRVYEPFFTTKSFGEDAGLGLAISKNIIIDHHGSIEVESEVGKGTIFSITLPIAQSNKKPN